MTKERLDAIKLMNDRYNKPTKFNSGPNRRRIGINQILHELIAEVEHLNMILEGEKIIVKEYSSTIIDLRMQLEKREDDLPMIGSEDNDE